MRRLLAAVLLMALSSTASAGISLTMEQPDTSVPDVLLRWEAEGPGPFTLLRRALDDGTFVSDVLPLDPVADSWRTGLSGGSVTLAGEASFATGKDLHVYQLIDGSDGSCSNLGYAALRRTLGVSSAQEIVLPERSAIPLAQGGARPVADSCQRPAHRAAPLRDAHADP